MQTKKEEENNDEYDSQSLQSEDCGNMKLTLGPWSSVG